MASSELSQWQQYTLRLLELQNQRHEQEIQRLIDTFTGLKPSSISRVPPHPQNYLQNTPVVEPPRYNAVKPNILAPLNAINETINTSIDPHVGAMMASKPATFSVAAEPTTKATTGLFGGGGGASKFNEIKTPSANNNLLFQNTSVVEPSKFNEVKPNNIVTPVINRTTIANSSSITSHVGTMMASKPVTFSFASVAAEAATKGTTGLFGGGGASKSNEIKTPSANLLFQFTPGSNRAVAVNRAEQQQKNNGIIISTSNSTTDASIIRESAENRRNFSEDEADDDEFVPDVEFTPVIPLPPLVEVRTGEEDDQTLFVGRCKLYRYDKTAKENKERGLGDIKILKNKANGKVRVVMRREHTLKLCANFPLFDSFKATMKQNMPSVYHWACKDYSEETEGVDEVFSARFKDANVAKEFAGVLEKAVKQIN